MIYVANWKMKLSRKATLELAGQYVDAFGKTDVPVYIAPTSLFLGEVSDIVKDSSLKLAAQDCSRISDLSAHTGDICTWQLQEYGVEAIIIGHSERRHQLGEVNEIVKAKFDNTINANMTAILCFGETKEERESGRGKAVVDSQLDSIFRDVDPDKYPQIILAYEPVWAISTNAGSRPPTVDEVTKIYEHIEKWLESNLSPNEIPVIYGGSVSPDNVGMLRGIDLIDGFIMGGASLDVEKFGEVLRAES